MTRRTAVAVCALLLASALIGIAGCSNKTAGPATRSLTVSSAVASGATTPAGQVAVQPRRVLPRAQRLVLSGLVATLRQTGVPSDGRYRIDLAAENSTDATMQVPVIGNAPRLLDRNGKRVKGAVSASGFGPGARRKATDVVDGRAINRKRANSSDVLPPHTSAVGVVWANDSFAGKGYSVRWNLGRRRVAVFRLP